MTNLITPNRHTGAGRYLNAFEIPGFRVALAIASLPGMTIELYREFLSHHTSLDFSPRAAERIQWCLSIDRSGKLKQSASERWARSATVWAMRRDAPCRSMLVWSAGAPLLLIFVQASPISLVADKAHG
jgi:hypothetical protein